MQVIGKNKINQMFRCKCYLVLRFTLFILEYVHINPVRTLGVFCEMQKNFKKLISSRENSFQEKNASRKVPITFFSSFLVFLCENVYVCFVLVQLNINKFTSQKIYCAVSDGEKYIFYCTFSYIIIKFKYLDIMIALAFNMY